MTQPRSSRLHGVLLLIPGFALMALAVVLRMEYQRLEHPGGASRRAQELTWIIDAIGLDATAGLIACIGLVLVIIGIRRVVRRS